MAGACEVAHAVCGVCVCVCTCLHFCLEDGQRVDADGGGEAGAAADAERGCGRESVLVGRGEEHVAQVRVRTKVHRRVRTRACRDQRNTTRRNTTPQQKPHRSTPQHNGSHPAPRSAERSRTRQPRAPTHANDTKSRKRSNVEGGKQVEASFFLGARSPGIGTLRNPTHSKTRYFSFCSLACCIVRSEPPARPSLAGHA